MKNKLLPLFSIFLLLFTLASRAQWVYKAPMAVNTGQHATVAHPNGNIYVFGGFAGSAAFNTLNIYNPTTDTWSTGANIPTITRGPAYVLGPDSSIYCFGGYDAGELSASYKYKPSTNTWTTLTSMPYAAWYSAAAKAVNGKIYVFGGETADDSLQIYDPVANTWSRGTPLPTPVKEHGAVAAPNGKIYIIGGLSGSATNLVQVYDPITNTWSAGANMPTARNQFGYTLSYNGMIYCIGGKTNGGNNQSPFFTVVEIYDPVLDSWSTGPILPKGLGETACAAINYGINVFGGADSSTTYSNVNLRLQLSGLSIESHAKNFSFDFFPNPASDNIHFGFFAPQSQHATLRIVDITGHEVYVKDLGQSSNIQDLTLQVSDFSKGIYFVQFICDNEMITKKLIIN